MKWDYLNPITSVISTRGIFFWAEVLLKKIFSYTTYLVHQFASDKMIVMRIK